MAHDLFVTLDFPPARGGVARYYDSLLRVLVDRRITVLAPKTSDQSGTQPPRHITVIRKRLIAPSWLWPRWVLLLIHVLWLLVCNRIDLLHVGQVLPVGTVALLARFFFRVPYCVYTHGLDVLNASRDPRKRSLAQRVLLTADRVVCNSHATKRLVTSLGVQETRIIMLHPGCSFVGARADENAVSMLRQRFALGESRILFSAGRLVERKGFRTAIRAFLDVATKYPDLHYVLVGDGPERMSLEALSKQKGLENRILFRGEVGDDELRNWYALCTAFLLVPTPLTGSDMEGFGIVYLEAAVFGKPVIASATGGVEDAVLHEKTGLVVPPEDVEATAGAIRRLLDDPVFAARLGAEGQRLVERDGTWNRRAEEFRRWLSSVQQKGGGNAV